MEKARVIGSPLINEDNQNDFIDRTFGYTWREHVGVIRGFCVRTVRINGGELGIMDITNLFDGVIQSFNRLQISHPLLSCDDSHLFLLLPGEVVTQVDVYSTEYETTTHDNRLIVIPGQIYVIRFHTNKRVSEWFGTCVGTLTQFKADEGYYVRAICGSVGSGHCRQVGVVYAQISPQNHLIDGPDQMKVTQFVGNRLGVTLSFHEQCEKPRAFVISIDHGIRDIAVVSEDQYEALQRWRATIS